MLIVLDIRKIIRTKITLFSDESSKIMFQCTVMQIRSGISLLLLFSCHFLTGQNEIVPLWTEEVPHFRDTGEDEERESEQILWISNVQQPDLAVYLPAKRNATGIGVVICPGGGYQGLAYDWEGSDIAKWFNAKGIAAFVLKYRLPVSNSVLVKHETPLLDAQQAMRLVQAHADRWNVDESKIGIMGFSAGGHLASTAGTHFVMAEDADIVRPDFMILIYPVISMNHNFTHMGSREALLGQDPSPEMIALYSNENQITTATPPTLLIHSMDDQAVPVKNSLVFYEGLIEKDVQAEMHLYPEGGHGYSLALDDEHLSTWPDRMNEWLKQLKFENEE